MTEQSPSNIASDYVPQHLGVQSRDPVKEIDRIPWSGGNIEVELTCSEFTCLCPVTRQPDFAALSIRYMPDHYIVETKSLKLYLTSFRNARHFNEDVTVCIAEDLYAQLQPHWIEVEGRFHSRGGIALHTRARRPSGSE
jgi:7-cyano-7-deazaguanine reductase